MRKIIHVDMDAFYASIEQRDHPEWRGKPVVVGGSPDSRGVVSTCSYEARTYGIHSAMPSAQAYKLCPHAIFVCHHDFTKYKEASRIIRKIFHNYTDLVEPLSLDEAYLDVTTNKLGCPSATRIARKIRREIKKQTGLSASAGVSYNKFIAKIASDINKPDGLTVIIPKEAQAFLEALPIRKFWGVGKKTEELMLSLGIKTGADLKKMDLFFLAEHFGKAGHSLYHAVRGMDERPVQPYRERKSLGRENTFAKDLLDMKEIMKELKILAQKVEKDCLKLGIRGHQLILKIKYHDFKICSRSCLCPRPLEKAEQFLEPLPALLSKTDAGKTPLRLLGLTLGHLEGNLYKKPQAQLELDLGLEKIPCNGSP